MIENENLYIECKRCEAKRCPGLLDREEPGLIIHWMVRLTTGVLAIAQGTPKPSEMRSIRRKKRVDVLIHSPPPLGSLYWYHEVSICIHVSSCFPEEVPNNLSLTGKPLSGAQVFSTEEPGLAIPAPRLLPSAQPWRRNMRLTSIVDGVFRPAPVQALTSSGFIQVLTSAAGFQKDCPLLVLLGSERHFTLRLALRNERCCPRRTALWDARDRAGRRGRRP